MKKPHTTEIKGKNELPFSQIEENLKTVLQINELDKILDSIFSRLYSHAKMFTSAPKIFAQDWNNEYVLKSIQETKINILSYADNDEITVKTSKNLDRDFFQIIEFLHENKPIKEIIYFETWFH